MRKVFLGILSLLLCQPIVRAAEPPAPSPSDTPSAPTTPATSRPADPNGISVAIFQDADCVPELRGRWPKNYNVFTDYSEETITVAIPDGRSFSHWSHM